MLKSLKLLAAGSLAAWAMPSQAAVAWSSPAGVQPGFSYNTGESAAGLFADPVAAGNFFSFFPDGMKLVASNGASASATDTASVNLVANPGASFATLSAVVVGDFTLLGPASTDVVGTLTVTNSNTQAVLSTPLTLAPPMPTSTATAAAGIFTGMATLALPAGWSSIGVDYVLTPSVGSSPGGTAIVDVKVAQISATTVIPEPTTLVLLPALALLARRR